MIFKNLGKMRFLKIAQKNCRLEKLKCLMFFKMARTVCIRLHFNLIKHFTQIHLSSKMLFFAFLTKNEEVQENFSKIPLNFCPCKGTHLGKKSFQYDQRILRKMRLKTFAYNFE